MFVYQRLYSVYSMLITTMKAVYIDSQEMYPININSSALPNTIFMIPFSMPQSVCPSHTLPNISYYSYPTYIYILYIYMYTCIYMYTIYIHMYIQYLMYIYIYNPLVPWLAKNVLIYSLNNNSNIIIIIIIYMCM